MTQQQQESREGLHLSVGYNEYPTQQQAHEKDTPSSSAVAEATVGKSGDDENEGENAEVLDDSAGVAELGTATAATAGTGVGGDGGWKNISMQNRIVPVVMAVIDDEGATTTKGTASSNQDVDQGIQALENTLADCQFAAFQHSMRLLRKMGFQWVKESPEEVLEALEQFTRSDTSKRGPTE
jgi:hypothetical protein